MSSPSSVIFVEAWDSHLVCVFLTVKVRHESLPHGSRPALAKCPLTVNGSTLTQHLLLDGFDPLLLLLRRGGWYPVNHMVAFDDAAVRLRFAGFDHLTFVIGVVELEAILRRGTGKEKASLRGVLFTKEGDRSRGGGWSLQVSWARPPLWYWGSPEE